MERNDPALYHQSHDWLVLQERWHAVAGEADLRLETVHEEDGRSVLVLENTLAATGEGEGLYLSAGVHGDECAPVLGLLEWAESSPWVFEEVPVTIFPCLNPRGLAENSRRDSGGRDLNRAFHDPAVPLIGAWQERIAGRRFWVAANLHEDYEAGGIYLYELVREQGESRGEGLLRACEGIIPREGNAEVDGSPVEKGLISRASDPASLRELVDRELEGGCPEAIQLFLHHTGCSLTFETPSEFDLPRRVAAHRAFLEAVVE